MNIPDKKKGNAILKIFFIYSRSKGNVLMDNFRITYKKDITILTTHATKNPRKTDCKVPYRRIKTIELIKKTNALATLRSASCCIRS